MYNNNDLLIVDNSSLDLFALCPRKYDYSVIEKIRSLKEAIPLTRGSAFHAGLYHYYKGNGTKVALMALIKRAHVEESRMTLYRSEVTKKTEVSIEFCVQFLKKYIDTHPLDAETFTPCIDTTGKPYLEVGFALDAAEDAIVVGKIDGIVERNDGLYILENKTTTKVLNEYYFADFHPNNQVTQYAWAVQELLGIKPKGIIINMLRMKDYKRPPKNDIENRLFYRLTTNRTQYQIDQYKRQVEQKVKLIKMFKEQGFDAFYQNAPHACNAYFSRCEYDALCIAQTHDLINIIINGGGYRKFEWTPYEMINIFNEDGLPSRIIGKEVEVLKEALSKEEEEEKELIEMANDNTNISDLDCRISDV